MSYPGLMLYFIFMHFYVFICFKLGRSKIFFQDKEKREFIETSIFKEAQKRLDEKRVLIITGHAGEGKSCMAKQLLLT